MTTDYYDYQCFAGTWEHDIERVSVAGHETLVSVMNLRPATTYNFRIVAENDLGTSEVSEMVTIISAEEGRSIFVEFLMCQHLSEF